MVVQIEAKAAFVPADMILESVLVLLNPGTPPYLSFNQNSGSLSGFLGVGGGAILSSGGDRAITVNRWSIFWVYFYVFSFRYR